MAKSNLKSINNNNITQLSACSVYNKYSFTYSIYIYLQYIIFFKFFIYKENYSIFKFQILENILLKYKKIRYYDFIKKKLAVIRNMYTYNITFKFFLINGSFTYIYDFYFLLMKGTPRLSITVKPRVFFKFFLTLKKKNFNLYKTFKC